MISHKNIMVSAMQGFIGGTLNRAVAPVSFSTSPIRPVSHADIVVGSPSPRVLLIFQLHWSLFRSTTAMG
jgi:hypothetical protein